MADDFLSRLASITGSKVPASPAATSATGSKKVAGYRPLVRTTGNKDYDKWYDEEGRNNDIDPNLLFAQGNQESSFNPKAKSSAGAMGIAQFMGDTAKEFGVNPNDPRSSINGQARLMRKLLDRTGDIDLALAGYNSGHNASIDRLRRNLERIPETKDYRNKIRKNYDGTLNATNNLDIQDQPSNFLAQLSTITQGGEEPSPPTSSFLSTLSQITGGEREQPATERPEAINAQVDAAGDPKVRTRFGVLTTTPEQNAIFGNRSDFTGFPRKEGMLWLNTKKIFADKKLKLKNEADLRQYVEKNPNALTTLIGIADNVGDATQGTAVVAKDKNGNELAAGVVTSPEKAAQQASNYADQFPNADIGLAKTDDIARQREEVDRLAPTSPTGEADDPAQPMGVAPPVMQRPVVQPKGVQPKSGTKAVATKTQAFDSKAFDEANAYLESQGQPKLTPEQFNATQQATSKVSISTDPNDFAIDGKKITDYELEMPAQGGGTIQFPREVGKGRDVDGVVAKYRSEKGMTEEQAYRAAMLNAGGRYGITPEMVNAKMARAKAAGKGLFQGGKHIAGNTIVITWDDLAEAGVDVNRERRMEQSQNTVQPAVDLGGPQYVTTPSGRQVEVANKDTPLPTFGEFVEQITGERDANNYLTDERKQEVDYRTQETVDDKAVNELAGNVLRSAIDNNVSPQNAEAIAGFATTATSYLSWLGAGLSDINDQADPKRIMPGSLLVDAIYGQKAGNVLGRFGNKVQKVNELSDPGDSPNKVYRIVGNTAGALPAYVVVGAAVGGNPVLTFAITDLLTTKGKGGSATDTLKAGAKGAVMGAMIGNLNRFGTMAADGLFGESLLKVVPKVEWEKAVDPVVRRAISRIWQAEAIVQSGGAEAVSAKKVIERELAKSGLTLEQVLAAKPGAVTGAEATTAANEVARKLTTETATTLEQNIDKAIGRDIARSLVETGVPIGIATGIGYGVSAIEGGSTKDNVTNALLFGAMQGLGAIFHKKKGEKLTPDEVNKADGTVIRVPDEKGTPRDLLLLKDKNELTVTDVTGKVHPAAIQGVVLPKAPKPSPTDGQTLAESTKLTEAEKAEATNVKMDFDAKVEPTPEVPKPKVTAFKKGAPKPVQKGGDERVELFDIEEKPQGVEKPDVEDAPSASTDVRTTEAVDVRQDAVNRYRGTEQVDVGNIEGVSDPDALREMKNQGELKQGQVYEDGAGDLWKFDGTNLQLLKGLHAEYDSKSRKFIATKRPSYGSIREIPFYHGTAESVAKATDLKLSPQTSQWGGSNQIKGVWFAEDPTEASGYGDTRATEKAGKRVQGQLLESRLDADDTSFVSLKEAHKLYDAYASQNKSPKSIEDFLLGQGIKGVYRKTKSGRYDEIAVLDPSIIRDVNDTAQTKSIKSAVKAPNQDVSTSKVVEAKEPWEMTREEFVKSQGKPVDDKYTNQQYDAVIRQAVKRGDIEAPTTVESRREAGSPEVSTTRSEAPTSVTNGKLTGEIVQHKGKEQVKVVTKQGVRYLPVTDKWKAVEKTDVEATPSNKPADVAPSIAEADDYQVYSKTFSDGQTWYGFKDPDGASDGAGNQLVSTKEDAQRSADVAKANAEFRAKAAEAENAKKAVAEQAKQERGNLNGFDAEMTPMRRGKVQQVLAKKWNFGKAGVKTAKQFIEDAVADGSIELTTEEVNRIKDMSRMAEFRATGEQQRAHEQRVKEGGKITQYLVNGLDLGKTAYDYATFLLNETDFVNIRQSVENKGQSHTSKEASDDAFVQAHKRERQRLMRRQSQANAEYAKNPTDEAYRKLEEADRDLTAFNSTKWVGMTHLNRHPKSYIALNRTQVKSSISNNGNYDAGEDSILKRALSDLDANIESFKNAATVPNKELLSTVDFRKNARVAEDGVIAIDEIPEIELVRRLLNNARKELGQTENSTQFYGVFSDQNAINALNKAIEGFVKKAPDAKTRKTLRDLQKLITQAAQGDGTVIFAMSEESVPEEKAHKVLYGNRDGDRASQIEKSVEDAIANSDVFKNAKRFQQAYSQFSQAAKVEEFSVKASLGQWNDLGITTDADKYEAMRQARLFYRSYADTNKGNLTLDKLLTKLSSEIAYAEEYKKYAEEYKNQEVQGNQKEDQVADESGVVEPARGASDKADAKTSGESKPDGLAFEPGGEVKQSKTPTTLRGNLDLPVQDIDYTSTTNPERKALADKILSQGVDVAEAWVYEQIANGQNNAGATVTVGIGVINNLGANGNIEQMNKLSKALLPTITDAAQTVQAVSTASMWNPESAAAYAGMAKQRKFGKGLTTKETQEAIEIAKTMHDNIMRGSINSAQLAELEGEMARLINENVEYKEQLEVAEGRATLAELDLKKANRQIKALQKDKTDTKMRVRKDVRKHLTDIEKRFKDIEKTLDARYANDREASDDSAMMAIPSVDQELVEWTMLNLSKNLTTKNAVEIKTEISQRANGRLSQDVIDEIHAQALRSLQGEATPLTPEQLAAKKELNKEQRNRLSHYSAARKHRLNSMDIDLKSLIKDGMPADVKFKFGQYILDAGQNYTPEATYVALARTKFPNGQQLSNPNDVIMALKLEYPDITPDQEAKALADSERLLHDAKENLKADNIIDAHNTKLTSEQIDYIRQDQVNVMNARRTISRNAQSFYEALLKTPGQIKTETLVNFRRANILTGLKTHGTNLVGNTTMAGYEETFRPVAAMTDYVTSKFTNERTVQSWSGGALYKSFRSLVKDDGLLKRSGKVTGITAAKDIWANGGTNEDMQRLQHAESILHRAYDSDTQYKRFKTAKAIDYYINKVYRSLGAEDALFKVFAFTRAMHESAYTQAVTEQKKLGKNKKWRQERQRQLIENPTQVMIQEADDFAQFMTFQNDNAVSTLFQQLKNVNWGVKAVSEVIIPFDRTPTNLIFRTLELMPGTGLIASGYKLGRIKFGKGKKFSFTRGFVADSNFNARYSTAIREDYKTELASMSKEDAAKFMADQIGKQYTRKAQADFARTVARMAPGNVLFALGGLLAAGGFLTGAMWGGDDDREEKKESLKRLSQGIENRSIYIPNVGRFVLPKSPPFDAMVAGATFYEQSQMGKGDIVLSAMDGASESLADIIWEQPLLNSTKELTGKLGKYKFGEFGGQIASGFVPASGFFREISEIGDPVRRTGSGFNGNKAEGKTFEGVMTQQGRAFKNSALKGVPIARNYLVDKSSVGQPDRTIWHRGMRWIPFVGITKPEAPRPYDKFVNADWVRIRQELFQEK